MGETWSAVRRGVLTNNRSKIHGGMSQSASLRTYRAGRYKTRPATFRRLEMQSTRTQRWIVGLTAAFVAYVAVKLFFRFVVY